MNKHQMKLEARKLLKEKLLALKEMMFDMCTDEYNAKVFTRNYKILKDIMNQYKNVINDIDNLIEKYCKEEKEVKNKINKHQKALDYLAENSMYETVKRRGKEIWKEVTHEGIEAQDLLQELVDRATPKKVKVWSFVNARGKYIDVYYCGSCNQSIDRIKYENYCFNCGQALDWSEENEYK